MNELKDKVSVSELAFGVHAEADNLFSAKVVKIKDGKVSEWKKGSGTSLGHAISMAQELMGAYAVQAIEKSPEKFYNEVVVI